MKYNLALPFTICLWLFFTRQVGGGMEPMPLPGSATLNSVSMYFYMNIKKELMPCSHWCACKQTFPTGTFLSTHHMKVGYIQAKVMHVHNCSSSTFVSNRSDVTDYTGILKKCIKSHLRTCWCEWGIRTWNKRIRLEYLCVLWSSRSGQRDEELHKKS